MPVPDPTRIHVEAKTVPIWEQGHSFQDLVAAQIQRAPWLMVSAVIHLVLLTLLWVLVPAEHRSYPMHAVEVLPPETRTVEQPPLPSPPEPQMEATLDAPILPETDLGDRANDSFAFDALGDAEAKSSAFDSNQWNAAVGLGGAAGGQYGGRASGRGGLGSGGPSGNGPGSGRATAVAIESGLEWLRDHQDADGKWDCDGFMKHDKPSRGEPCDGPGNGVHDVGVTGLALLAFLGDGSTMRSGAYKESIKRGVLWLRENQQADGLFGNNASNDYLYDHAIATYAMCEAFGLSNYTLLKRNAQQGINYLESHRNPHSVWRYQPRDNDNDTSLTGWCIMAYQSGRYFKLDVNQDALRMSERWLDQVTDQNGRAGYTRPGEVSSRHAGDHGVRFPAERGESMTAVSLFCRFFMNQDPAEKPVMKQAAELLRQKPPVYDRKSGAIDYYYWYYATYAMYQMGKPYWTDWSEKLGDAVLKPQRQDGNFRGSWDPIDVWGEDGGRVYATATLVLTLEAYYRYTKLIR